MWYGICTIWVENLILKWFYKRSQAYFGQKPEEHGFLIKKRCLEVKNDDFLENMLLTTKYVFFFNFSRSWRARAGPIWALMDPENSEIRKQIALLGALHPAFGYSLQCWRPRVLAPMQFRACHRLVPAENNTWMPCSVFGRYLTATGQRTPHRIQGPEKDDLGMQLM